MNDEFDQQWASLQRALIRYISEPDRVDARDQVLTVLDSDDFTDGAHGLMNTIFRHAVGLHQLDPTWHVSQLEVSMGLSIPDAQAHLDLLFRTEVLGVGMAHAMQLVAKMVNLRQQRRIYAELMDRAISAQHDGIADPYALADKMRARLAEILDDGLERWPLYDSPHEIVAQAREDWVLRELLLPGEVLMATAGGGIGKSELLRQLAFCAANSLHPWTAASEPATGGRSLVLDFETQSHNVKASFINMGNRVAHALGIPADEIQFPMIVSMRQRVDLRSGSDLAEFRRILSKVRPRLVCIGPLKNIYSERDGESYSNAALEVQDILMRTMTDFDCALAIEAHGTKMDQGSTAGSQRWADWPDMAFTIEPVAVKPESVYRKRRRDEEPDSDEYQTWAQQNTREGDGIVRVYLKRGNRNSLARVPTALTRTRDQVLPWMGMSHRPHENTMPGRSSGAGYQPPPPTDRDAPPDQGSFDDEPF